MPPSGTLVDPPGALSAIVNVAERAPAADGENVTLIEQDAPTPREVPQVFVWAKSARFVPESVMLPTVIGAVPESVNLMLCAALVVRTFCPANVRLAGATVATGPG